MNKGKAFSKSLREIQKALDNASDQELISKEGYDLVRAVIAAKMKKKSSCLDGFDALDGFEKTCPPPPEADECIVVEECIIVEEERPGHLEEEASSDPVLVEEPIELCCVDELPWEQAAATEDREKEEVPEATAATASLGEEADTVEESKSGFGFTWCVRCARVDVVLYGSKTLPAELRGTESGLDNGIAAIMCGCCKRKGAEDRRGKYIAGSHGFMGDVDLRSSFEKLRLSPAIFRGSEVAEAARAILSVEVAFIAVNDGVAFKDIDEVVRSLTTEDRLTSVDMNAFRLGKKENLLLPYLVGGLTR